MHKGCEPIFTHHVAPAGHAREHPNGSTENRIHKKPIIGAHLARIGGFACNQRTDA
jgi:hypothetical protein